MKKIEATLVKTLRQRTGAGVLDCKKALVETEGQLDAAVEVLKKLGHAIAEKKSTRAAVQGCVCVESDEHRQTAVMVEINCETDFMAKDPDFREFCDTVIQAVVAREAFGDIDVLRQAFESERTALIARTGEHLHIRRVAAVSGERVITYAHGGGRIGVIVAASGSGDGAALKTVAMQIAAMNPVVLNVGDLTDAHRAAVEGVYDSEQALCRALVLSAQPLITSTSQTVQQFVTNAELSIEMFQRFELGEGLERPLNDFAAEVNAAQKQPHSKS